MKSISLLPKSIKSPDRSYVYRLLIIVFTILIIASLVSWVVLFINTRKMNSNLKILKEQRKSIEKYLEDNDDVLTAEKEINRLREAVEKAMGNVPEWSSLLDDINKYKTNDMHNRIVRGSYDETKAVVTINGSTNSQRSIKTYMDKIKELDTVDDGELSYVRQSDPEDDSRLEFEIVIYLIQENQYKIDDR
ncbi:MAG: hypothetical protein GX160_09485 [Clostridiales bacterium]|nr:hypothetical protein [Clostridiales bacterium]